MLMPETLDATNPDYRTIMAEVAQACSVLLKPAILAAHWRRLDEFSRRVLLADTGHLTILEGELLDYEEAHRLLSWLLPYIDKRVTELTLSEATLAWLGLDADYQHILEEKLADA